jgi:ubiquitin-conjugating enzyme E2 S
MSYHHHSSSSTSENLPPRTIARLVREVRDLVQTKSEQQAVEGIRLIVDLDTGLPANLGELSVRLHKIMLQSYYYYYYYLLCDFWSAFGVGKE